MRNDIASFAYHKFIHRDPPDQAAAVFVARLLFARPLLFWGRLRHAKPPQAPAASWLARTSHQAPRRQSACPVELEPPYLDHPGGQRAGVVWLVCCPQHGYHAGMPARWSAAVSAMALGSRESPACGSALKANWQEFRPQEPHLPSLLLAAAEEHTRRSAASSTCCHATTRLPGLASASPLPGTHRRTSLAGAAATEGAFPAPSTPSAFHPA